MLQVEKEACQMIEDTKDKTNRLLMQSRKKSRMLAEKTQKNMSHDKEVLKEQSKRNWTGNPFQIGVILDYIIFKEMEVRNLIAITEAKRIGFSKDTVNKYLVNVPGKF